MHWTSTLFPHGDRANFEFLRSSAVRSARINNRAGIISVYSRPKAQPRVAAQHKPSNTHIQDGTCLSHQAASDDDASRRHHRMVASGGGGRARNHHPSGTHPTGVVPGRAACSRRRCGAATYCMDVARRTHSHTNTNCTALHHWPGGCTDPENQRTALENISQSEGARVAASSRGGRVSVMLAECLAAINTTERS